MPDGSHPGCGNRGNCDPLPTVSSRSRTATVWPQGGNGRTVRINAYRFILSAVGARDEIMLVEQGTLCVGTEPLWAYSNRRRMLRKTYGTFRCQRQSEQPATRVLRAPDLVKNAVSSVTYEPCCEAPTRPLDHRPATAPCFALSITTRVHRANL